MLLHRVFSLGLQQPRRHLVLTHPIIAAIKTLYPTNLSFAIRGRGCGSASASDILISLSAPDFQAINLIQHKNDSDNKGPIIDVSAGCNWGAVDAFVEKEAPGFAVVGARCPYVGVAGSTLTGGFSWLSHTYGLSSDPDNLLDVQILLHDGELVWAFTRPDLLWALRGGGANFGVAVTFRFRARPYPASVFAGLVFFPESAVREVSRRVAKWANDVVDEKMALHVFVVDSNPGLALHGGSATPRLMALMFDGNGEEHGRSGDGFGWLLGVPGAKEAEGENKPRMMSLREVHELQRGGQETHGKGCSWLEAALVGEGPDGLLDDDVLVRSWDWYLQVVREEPDLARGSFVLLEIMQRAAFTSGETPGDTAWPHGQNGRRHVLQLSTGCAPVKDDKLPDARRRALQLMKEAPAW